MYNMRVASFIWGKMRMIAQVTGSQITEKLLRRGTGEGQYVCDFGEGGVQAIRQILQKVSASHRSSPHHEGF